MKPKSIFNSICFYFGWFWIGFVFGWASIQTITDTVNILFEKGPL